MNRQAGPSHAALARVDVLIVNYNAGDWLARCIARLRPENAEEPRVVVVDNGSTDSSLQALDENGLTIDRLGRNTGFAAGVNRAASQATREFLLMLNPDCLIEPATLARLVEELDRHSDCALVSGKVLDTDGKEQRGSRRRLPTPARVVSEILPLGGAGIDLTHTPAPNEAVEVEAVSGACMLIRAQVFRIIGGLDEGYPMHFEDLDLFQRMINAGHKLRWLPDVEIRHAGGQSSRTRPAGVVIDKHRGLWRYLNQHCRNSWPAWQRPLCALVLAMHLCLKLALTLVLRK